MKTIKELEKEARQAYLDWKKYRSRFMYKKYLRLGRQVIGKQAILKLIDELAKERGMRVGIKNPKDCLIDPEELKARIEG